MPIIARRLSIRGRVQGVFFRDWAIQAATQLGIAGWVRNRTDGSVEALAIGEADAVEAFIARCRTGSPAARVDDVEIMEAEPEPMAGFQRRPTA